MKGITVISSVTLEHRKLGAEVWEWDAGGQAEFLVGFAETFKAAGGAGIMQIHYIAEELKAEPANLTAARWLSDLLAIYLEEA